MKRVNKSGDVQELYAQQKSRICGRGTCVRSLSFKVLVLPAISLCFTLQISLEPETRAKEVWSGFEPAKKLDARHAQGVVRHANGGFLSGESRDNKATGSLKSRLGLNGILDRNRRAEKKFNGRSGLYQIQAAKAAEVGGRDNLEALAATLGLRGMTMLNLLLRLTKTLPAAFFFLGGAAFILRGALLRLKSPMKGLEDLLLGLAARVAPTAAGFAAAAAGAAGVPAFGPRAANVRVAMVRAKGSERMAGAAAIKARKACMLYIPLLRW